MKKILFSLLLFFGTIALVKAESIKVDTFESLVNAFNSVDAKIEIELAKDIYMTNKISIAENKEVILTGNSYTLYRDDTYLNGFFAIPASSSLTLKDVIVDGGADSWELDYDNQISLEKGYISVPLITNDDLIATESLIINEGDLNISDSTIKNAISSNKSSVILNTGNINITGSEFIHNYTDSEIRGGVINSQRGKLIIESSKFENNGDGKFKGGSGSGGAISVFESEFLKISNSIFENNYSQWNGGAIMIESTNVDISNTTFKANKVGNDGGAISLRSSESLTNNYDANFKSVTFDSNEGLSLDSQSLGGAISLQDGWNSKIEDGAKKIIFEDSVFKNNISCSGGVYADYGFGYVVFKNSTFENNYAKYNGGVFYTQSSNVEVINSNINNNKAKGAASVLYMRLRRTFTLDNSVVTNNSTDGKGTIALNPSYDASFTSLYLKNNTIITNNSATHGGGLYINNKGGRAAFVSMDDTVKIYNNNASVAGDDIVIARDESELLDYYIDKAGANIIDASKMNINGIDGWYLDEETARYKDADTPTKFEIPENYIDTVYLKAAGHIELQYDLNGGSSDYTYETESTRYGADFDIVTDEPTKSVAKFIGWNTEKDGSGHWYYAGDKYNGEYGNVLYAQYEFIKVDNPETIDSLLIVIIVLVISGLLLVLARKKMKLNL